MIGIFIGISAVVSLISLGQGLENSITEQFEELGADKITIMGKAGSVSGPAASSISGNPLTQDDVEFIEGIKGVELVGEMLFKSARVQFKDEVTDLAMMAMDPEDSRELFKSVSSWKTQYGRDLEKDDNNKIVLGYDIAFNVFEKDIEVRDKVSIYGENFKVVGIMQKIGSPDDFTIFIPLNSARNLFNEPDLVSMIFVKIKKGYEPSEMADKIEEELGDYRGEKGESKSFTVTTSEELLDALGNILGIVLWVLIGIAAISLFVGGVGIMNTMYTSVLERTKDIGIMKAIGAKNSDIMKIFLIESGMLGLIGGFIGVGLGLGLAKLVEYAAYQRLGSDLLRAMISPNLIIGSLIFSFVVGSLSGLFPARKAAKMKPVDALRYE
jgi:putative ABC transport system permease protein